MPPRSRPERMRGCKHPRIRGMVGSPCEAITRMHMRAGFAVGRTIFAQPSRAWLAGEIDDRTLIAQIRSNFEFLIQAWRDARA